MRFTFACTLVTGALSCGGESVLGSGTGGAGAGGSGGAGIGATGGTDAGNGGLGGSSGATGGVSGFDGTGNVSGFDGTGGVSGFGSEAGSSGIGAAGTGVSESYVPLCDLAVAMPKNCARGSCHNATTRSGGLDMIDPALVPARLVDRPAQHSDFGCNVPGSPYRECTPDELTTRCPPKALLVDSENPDESWVLKKLRGQQGTCGDAMPLPPGDAPANGWNAERRLCLEDWFYEMARFAREQADTR